MGMVLPPSGGLVIQEDRWTGHLAVNGRIKIQKMTGKEVESKGISSWPIWEKEVSEFPWEYKMTESCYIIEGEATVTPEDGEPVLIERGDYVIFPKGMKCTWKITEAEP